MEGPTGDYGQHSRSLITEIKSEARITDDNQIHQKNQIHTEYYKQYIQGHFLGYPREETS